MKTRWVVILGVFTIILFFSIQHFNDNREKGLDELLSYNTSKFESLVFNEGSQQLEWRTDDGENAEAFRELVSQYKVKKMREDEWDSDVSKEEGFTVSIYTKNGPVMASIYEHRIHYYNRGYYYHVINGPIQMDSFKEFMETVGDN